MRRMNYGKTNGSEFRKFRLANNITQLRMSQLLGMSWSNYLLIERGTHYNEIYETRFLTLKQRKDFKNENTQ